LDARRSRLLPGHRDPGLQLTGKRILARGGSLRLAELSSEFPLGLLIDAA